MREKYRRMLRALREAPDGGEKPEWSVYIVRCGDESLYTGIAKDVAARIEKHNSGRGAAYTRSRRPVSLVYREEGLTRSEALVREASIKSLPKSRKARLGQALALLLALSSGSWAVPSFNKESGTRISSAAVSAATGAYPTLRLYTIRGSSQVYSATTADGLAWTEESGVRLSSLTVPAIDIAVSSITGLSILPLDAGGFRMLYSVIGTTGAFRIYSATSADGLSWANDTGTRVDPGDGATFAGLPSLVELGSGDWRLYYIQNSISGNQETNHQVFSALSTNQGLNWSTGAVVVSTQAGAVAATLRTDGKVRLYYTAPVSGATTYTTIASALSSNTNGTSFSSESGVRLSTGSSSGTLSAPLVVRSTDSFRWRLYYNFAPPGVSTAAVFSAATDAPDPTALSPSTVFRNAAASQYSISGEIFSTGVAAKLARGGQADVAGTALTRTDDQKLTVTFDTQGKELGLWNLIVTNSNGLSTTLSNALLLDFQGGSAVLTDNLIRPRQGTATTIDVTLYASGRAILEIYTLNGEKIATILDRDMPEGTFTATWNGRTAQGSTVASGVYLLRASGPKLNVINKIVVIK